MVIAQQRLGGALEDLSAENGELAREVTRLERELAEAEGRGERFSQERDDLLDRLAEFEKKLAEARSAQMEAVPVEVASEIVEEPVASLEPEEEEQPEEERPRRRGDGPPEMDDQERRERREDWRRNMETRTRERVQDFLGAAIEQSKDAATKERLASLAEYADYMTELWGAIRDAETDEERGEYMQLMGETRDAIEGLMREQQDFMLTDLAKENGITSTADQEAFVESVQSVISSPFFRGGPGGFGGFGGFGGRGPGGGGPGGPAAGGR